MGNKFNYFVSYIDIWKDTFEVRNYDTNDVKTMSIGEFRNFFESITENTIIYQNDLNIVAHIIKGGTISGKKKSKNGESYEILSYSFDNVRFKSFTALCPSDQTAQTLMSVYKTSTETESMIKHLEYLNSLNGKDGIRGIRSTICGQAVQIFYRDIKNDLWQWKKDHKVYVNTLDEFNILHAGCKCGILKDIQEYTRYGECVEFDLSAAYCGAFIQSDKFPIGKPRFTDDPRKFIDALANGENAKVVFNERIPEIDEATKALDLDLFDDFNNVLALEYYDLKLLSELGINIISILKKYKDIVKKFVTYDETGRIHKLVRDKIVELQKDKERYAKGTPERSIVKSQMEFIYGKAIQKRDYWNSDEDVIKHYRHRGENYMMPHMSNHASAYVRYQIFKAIKALGDDVFYFDTDGIKVADNDRTWTYFAEENARLFELNQESGYDTNIGTWKQEEFDEILLFRSKMYITVSGEEINYVIAGWEKESMIILAKEFFENNIKTAHEKLDYIQTNLLPMVHKDIFVIGDHVEFDYSGNKTGRLTYRKGGSIYD